MKEREGEGEGVKNTPQLERTERSVWAEKMEKGWTESIKKRERRKGERREE